MTARQEVVNKCNVSAEKNIARGIHFLDKSTKKIVVMQVHQMLLALIKLDMKFLILITKKRSEGEMTCAAFDNRN